ncbi:MAG: glycoside hydrolase family 57 protein [Candidatus Omnitrophica bacterium]|nr:glycoside hydrolase family 57 protein [Candidatus Omnitrophota bacterium]
MDTNKTLGVAFLWHMHQPFYKDPLSDKYMMPWVRLRGVKDYFPMAALVDRAERFKATFNLVPSLLEQINDYVYNSATDTFLDLTVKKASSLSFQDKVSILEHFFKVNFNRFIEPNPAYSRLLMKKGVRPLSGAALKSTVKDFSDQDFLDLQVLFNMAWFHSINIDEDNNLKTLVDKKNYTEEDKAYVVSKQREILGRIIPLYKKLHSEGKIEITTTPFYHPILPLLCDTSVASVSTPDMELPKRFRHPEDAGWQIAEAVKYHTAQFGVKPRGMWPSEGSVSDQAVDVMISKGIKWAATDEDILFRTLSSYDRRYKGVELFDRRIIYRPYKVKRDRGSMTLIFRDKNLSDMISFSYNSWNPRDAAWDVIGHCRTTAHNLRRDADIGLMTIVMDGENAWEYYEDNGRRFFETLYANLDSQEEMCSTTISGYLAVDPPKRVLSNIFPGSWINHNFRIWIGTEQDNVSWDYLARARKDLVRFSKEPGAKISDVTRAWRELYIAEGSDWNWWYNGKAHVGGDNPFDELYLTHLQNIYKILKKPVPDFTKIFIA